MTMPRSPVLGRAGARPAGPVRRRRRRGGWAILAALGVVLAALVLVDGLNVSQASWLDLHQLPHLAATRRDVAPPTVLPVVSPQAPAVVPAFPTVAPAVRVLLLVLVALVALLVLSWCYASIRRRGPPAGPGARLLPLRVHA
jgi:hypothetical protein